MVNCAQFALLNQIGISRRHSQIQDSLPLAEPYLLARCMGKWGSDQESLLNSWRYRWIWCESNSCPTKLSDSLTKVVLVRRLALDYCLAEQGCFCSVANTICNAGLTFLGKLRFNYVRSWNKPFGLKKCLLIFFYLTWGPDRSFREPSKCLALSSLQSAWCTVFSQRL